MVKMVVKNRGHHVKIMMIKSALLQYQVSKFCMYYFLSVHYKYLYETS